jgi:predicted SAM-dependent methyltransferase
MILRNKCIKCNKHNEIIHTQYDVPISFTSVEINTDYKYSNISYGYCNKCNIIQLNELIELDILYATGHNYQVVGNTWKQYFAQFTELLIPYIKNKNILEIGCPSGKIATNCHYYNSWNIIDPNVKIFDNKKINSISNFFDDKSSFDFNVDVIVHSHLFEHIYYPIPFLNKCYNILEENGYMIFGIPNMEYIMKNKISLYFGVMFEHNIFYSVTNVKTMLEECKFKILDISFYKNHSIFFKVQKTNSSGCEYTLTSNVFNTDYLNLKEQFMENIMYYDNCIKTWINYLDTKTDNKVIYIFGASYNTSLLLHKISNRINIKGILDNCVEKQGQYFYGYNCHILSPTILENENAIVILKNGVYVEEIKKQILELNINTIFLE